MLLSMTLTELDLFHLPRGVMLKISTMKFSRPMSVSYEGSPKDAKYAHNETIGCNSLVWSTCQRTPAFRVEPVMYPGLVGKSGARSMMLPSIGPVMYPEVDAIGSHPTVKIPNQQCQGGILPEQHIPSIPTSKITLETFGNESLINGVLHIHLRDSARGWHCRSSCTLASLLVLSGPFRCVFGLSMDVLVAAKLQDWVSISALGLQASIPLPQQDGKDNCMQQRCCAAYKLGQRKARTRDSGKNTPRARGHTEIGGTKTRHNRSRSVATKPYTNGQLDDSGDCKVPAHQTPFPTGSNTWCPSGGCQPTASSSTAAKHPLLCLSPTYCGLATQKALHKNDRYRTLLLATFQEKIFTASLKDFLSGNTRSFFRSEVSFHTSPPSALHSSSYGLGGTLHWDCASVSTKYRMGWMACLPSWPMPSASPSLLSSKSSSSYSTPIRGSSISFPIKASNSSSSNSSSFGFAIGIFNISYAISKPSSFISSPSKA
ncbi:uncharacterized protein G2W53_018068 [Senna tora]|uniref:Uncharacterized protein n=1 Tax=Senna tora TaxID=362788 RepID=A0A834TZU9_9FABA|nr:uncharacterized protein G2W53_018068 [Senna tora]